MNRMSLPTKTVVFGTAFLALSVLTACASAPQQGSPAADAAQRLQLVGPLPAARRELRVGQAGQHLRQQAGVTIKRTAYDTTDLSNKALLAAQQGNAPDVMLLDNPVVSTLAQAGMLATTRLRARHHGVAANIIAAGRTTARPTASRSAPTPWRSTTTRRSSKTPASTPPRSRTGTRSPRH